MSGNVGDIISQTTELVPLEYSVYQDNWSGTYRGQFSDILDSTTSDFLDLTLEFAGIDASEGSIFEKLLRQSEETVFVFSLYKFLDDKRLSIRDLASKREHSVRQGEEIEYVLEQLLDGDENLVYHIFLYNEWLDSSDKIKYRVQNQLPDDYRSRFEENSRGIQMTLSRKTRARNFRYNSRNRMEFEDSTIFSIDRQASDTEARDMASGSQRRRDVKTVFLEVNHNEDTIRIDTSSSAIRETLKTKIEEVFSILTVEADWIEDDDELTASRFADEFTKTDIEDDDNSILSAQLRQTNTQPSIPIALSKQSEERDIRPVLAKFSDEIADINLQNIRKFWFSHLGTNARVKIEENIENNFLRLNADIKTRSETRQDQVSETFHEDFGIPLNEKIPLHLVAKTRERLISQMLKGVSAYEARYIRDDDLVKTLTDDLGVLDKDDVEHKQCEGCGNIYLRDYDMCQKCGGNLEVFYNSFELELSKSGTRRYFEKLVKDEGLTYYGQKREGIYGREFEFYQIGDKGEIIRVLLNVEGGNLTPGSAKYLRKSIHPVLVLNPGTVIDENLIEEITSEVIDLGDLIEKDIDDELPDNYISKRLHSVARTTEKRISDNAHDAFKQLGKLVTEPEDYSGGEFEQDAFHIIKQAIVSTEQWGEKRRGNQPDGFGELFFYRNDNEYFRSFAYDGKFTTKDEINMSSKEAEMLRTYALKIYKSDEVKSSDSKFQNFIVITNARPGNFGSVGAKKLNGMRKWNGIPVLMHSDFLLGLYIGYNENMELIKDNIHDFYEQLYLTLNDGKLYHQNIDREYYVHLTREDAKVFFENFRNEASVSGLDITELREFLEKDILPV
ncbi:hypothetical protein [Haloplanus vescus]|nr:hypothetical protein [Haloplanus vescus]